MSGILRRLVAAVGILSLGVMDMAMFTPVLSNGFWEVDRVQGFHLAYWTSILCFLFFIARG